MVLLVFMFLFFGCKFLILLSCCFLLLKLLRRRNSCARRRRIGFRFRRFSTLSILKILVCNYVMMLINVC